MIPPRQGTTLPFMAELDPRPDVQVCSACHGGGSVWFNGDPEVGIPAGYEPCPICEGSGGWCRRCNVPQDRCWCAKEAEG